jgi:hypothetical protein
MVDLYFRQPREPMRYISRAIASAQPVGGNTGRT